MLWILDLCGLIQFVPAVVLTLLIGHTADRYDRRLIVRVAQGVYVLAAVMITIALLKGVLGRDLVVCCGFHDRLRSRLRDSRRRTRWHSSLVPVPMISRASGGTDLRQSDRHHLRPGPGRPCLTR